MCKLCKPGEQEYPVQKKVVTVVGFVRRRLLTCKSIFSDFTMAGISADAALEITNAIHQMLHCMDEGTSQSCDRFASLFTEDGEINIPMVKVRKVTLSNRFSSTLAT